MVKNYINLTNGIEAISQFNLTHYSFIRIQSTACEQHLWDRLLQDLDYDFLMNAALGNECIIYDYGTRKPVPRAVYQGIEFIKFVLNKFWYGATDEAFISRSRNSNHKVNVTDYFNKAYYSLSEQTRTKLKYFSPSLEENLISTVSHQPLLTTTIKSSMLRFCRRKTKRKKEIWKGDV